MYIYTLSYDERTLYIALQIFYLAHIYKYANARMPGLQGGIFPKTKS